MSFCCGASMIGHKGTLKHIRTRIHNVPLLSCPVCHRVEVHYLVMNEYEILAEYAHGDGASDVDFQEYVDQKNTLDMFENCVKADGEDPLDVMRNLIDAALDLLPVAQQLNDSEWEAQLKKRLYVLSEKWAKMKNKKASRGMK